MNLLTPLQQDAIVESFNVGVGVAAAALAEIVGEEVLMSVPDIALMPASEALMEFGVELDTPVTAIFQMFQGVFSSDAVLVFPERDSLQIVRAMLQDSVPVEGMSELAREAMLEVGNIILNACISGLAEVFQSHFESDLPRFTHGPFQALIGRFGGAGASMLVLKIDFSVHMREVSGRVAFLLDMPSMDGLEAAINRLLGGLGAEIGISV